MKIYTTNYFDTFIEVADDTKVNYGMQPPSKDKKTVAEMQYEMISKNPYKYYFRRHFLSNLCEKKRFG